MTNRELMYATLEFRNDTGRAPTDLWLLPWAQEHYPEEFNAIINDYPTDIVYPPVFYAQPPITSGDAYAVGTYTDEWGCIFTNVHSGIIGEVKNPIMPEDDED